MNVCFPKQKLDNSFCSWRGDMALCVQIKIIRTAFVMSEKHMQPQ